MNNKFLIFLAKAVGTLIIFFVCDLIFQYFETGVPDPNKALRFALIYGGVLIVGREIYNYSKNRKK